MHKWAHAVEQFLQDNSKWGLGGEARQPSCQCSYLAQITCAGMLTHFRDSEIVLTITGWTMLPDTSWSDLHLHSAGSQLWRRPESGHVTVSLAYKVHMSKETLVCVTVVLVYNIYLILIIYGYRYQSESSSQWHSQLHREVNTWEGGDLKKWLNFTWTAYYFTVISTLATEINMHSTCQFYTYKLQRTKNNPTLMITFIHIFT